jgi:hypothetical protein
VTDEPDKAGKETGGEFARVAEGLLAQGKRGESCPIPRSPH